MPEFLIFLNGLLVSAILGLSTLIYFITKTSRDLKTSLNEDLKETLAAVQETHNQLMENQIKTDTEIGDIKQSLAAIHNRFGSTPSTMAARHTAR